MLTIYSSILLTLFTHKSILKNMGVANTSEYIAKEKNGDDNIIKYIGSNPFDGTNKVVMNNSNIIIVVGCHNVIKFSER